MASGLQRLGDLRLLGEGWKTLEVLEQQAGCWRDRLLERFLWEVQEALSEPVRGVFEQPRCCAANVSATAGDGRDWGLARGSGGLVRFQHSEPGGV